MWLFLTTLCVRFSLAEDHDEHVEWVGVFELHRGEMFAWTEAKSGMHYSTDTSRMALVVLDSDDDAEIEAAEERASMQFELPCLAAVAGETSAELLARSPAPSFWGTMFMLCGRKNQRHTSRYSRVDVLSSFSLAISSNDPPGL